MGATYAHEQLPVLARAVARAACDLGVPGRIRMLGRGSADRLRAEMRAAKVDVEIEGTGHVDEKEGVKLLRECFLLYVNYPFGRRDVVLGQTSFPTKLSTYVMAARPVLAHAPRGTTLEGLSSFPGYARPWTSMNEGDGAAILTRAWRAPETSASAHALAESVRLRYYDPETNKRALFAALNGLLTASAR
jgi:hypothetical protein